MIKPCYDRFEYSIVIRNAHEHLYQQLIYIGRPSSFYADDLFKTARWSAEHLIVSGAEKEVDFIINIKNKSFAIKNLTIYSPPPIYGMMQWENSDDVEKKSYENWLHFIGPTVAAAVLYREN